MLPEISPAVLEGRSLKNFKILDKTVDILQVRPARTKNNYIFISRNSEDPRTLHFDVYDKSCKMTERFAVSRSKGTTDGVITNFQTTKNNVMRPRDPLVSPNSNMTFEQILQARPVIVKRISTLLQNAVNSFSHYN